MQSNTIIVGIDVSKATLDYTWLPNGITSQAADTAPGIAGLVQHIKRISPDMVVLEATGGYQNALVESLHEASLPVKVANPRQVRDFVRSLNRLWKPHLGVWPLRTIQSISLCIAPDGIDYFKEEKS